MPESLSNNDLVPLVSRLDSRHSLSLVPRPPEDVPDLDEDLEIPYYDSELDVSQSEDHMKVIAFLLPFIRYVAETLGLKYLSDNPAHYPEAEGVVKDRYGDLVFAKQTGEKKVFAIDLLWVAEVVTTSSKKKEDKDTITQKDLNERHGVADYVLFWPEPDDDQVLDWFRLNEDRGLYEKMDPDGDGLYHALAVPGLAFKPLPRESWQPGRKVEGYFEGKAIGDLGDLLEQIKVGLAEMEIENNARRAAESAKEEETRAREKAEAGMRKEAKAREKAEEEVALAKEGIREEAKAREKAEEEVALAKEGMREEAKARERAEEEAERAKGEAERLRQRLLDLGLDP